MSPPSKTALTPTMRAALAQCARHAPMNVRWPTALALERRGLVIVEKRGQWDLAWCTLTDRGRELAA